MRPLSELIGWPTYIQHVLICTSDYKSIKILHQFDEVNSEGNKYLGPLSLGHTSSRDHRIARLVTNLGDVRLVTTTNMTKDQSSGFTFGLPLMLFGKRHFMIGCDKIRTVMWPSSWIYNLYRKGEPRRIVRLQFSHTHIMKIDKRTDFGG